MKIMELEHLEGVFFFFFFLAVNKIYKKTIKNWSFSSGVLGNVEYPFIVIILRSTLIRSGRAC